MTILLESAQFFKGVGSFDSSVSSGLLLFCKVDVKNFNLLTIGSTIALQSYSVVYLSVMYKIAILRPFYRVPLLLALLVFKVTVL